jgi:hypothetical protein
MKSTLTSVVALKDKHPHEGDRVIVISKKFRCLGYLDRNGIWRDEVHKKELRDVIAWMKP